MKTYLIVIALFSSVAAAESIAPFTMYRDEFLISDSKTFYWQGAVPCSNIADYLNAGGPTRLFDYTNPRYNVDATYGPGCRYDLITRAGAGYPVGTVIPNWFAQNWVEPVAVCADGYTLYDDYTVSPSVQRCSRHDPPPVNRPPCCEDGYNTGPLTAGKPINFGTGEKVQIKTDHTNPGDTRLSFQRYLRIGLWPYLRSKIGANWSHSFNRELFYVGATAVHPIGISDPSGFWTWFKPSGATFVSMYHPADIIYKVALSGGAYEWHRHKPNDSVEVYDSAGRNTRIETREGRFLTLTYDAQSRLASVSNEYGRTLRFAYGTNGDISRIDLPDGNALTYDYSTDSPPRLLTVHYPGGTQESYTYNSAGQLIGIIDEKGVAFETITYNPYGKAIATTLIGGVNRYAYTGAAANDLPKVYGYERAIGSYDLATPLTTVHITTVNVNGAVLPATMSSSCPECGVDGSALTYDPNGAVTSVADFSGKKVCYSHDTSRNLETARADGILVSESCSTVLATLPARAGVHKVSTQWHATLRVPVKVAEPNKITTYAYNGDGGVYCAPASARGVLCKWTVRDTTDATGQLGFGATYTGLPRVWQHTYNQFGQELTTIDSSGRVTTTTYTASGDIHTVNSPGGQLTVTSYDGAGRPLALTDLKNGAITLTYWPRGKLRTYTDGGVTTSFTYDAIDQLTKVVQPDGSVTYTYGAAHRLWQLQDNLGRKIVYTLDAAGNRIAKQTYDATGKRVQGVRRTDGFYFVYYGYWCGPNWTGGFNREYGQIGPGDDILPPIDTLDRCCYSHDVCYWKCRCDHGCSPTDRGNCMTTCDRTLASCAEDVMAAGGSPGLIVPFWYWFKFNIWPQAGPNANSCTAPPTDPMSTK